MARRRKNGITVEVDPRTRELSSTVLICRDLGHAWSYVPMGPKRRAELSALGQYEKIQICDRCGCEKTTLYAVRERCPVASPSSKYGEGYLLPHAHKGSGRLPRQEAFFALMERQEI